LSAKASDRFENLGDAEKIEFALTEFAALQARVDKLLIGVPN
jgi:hypothetical protein